MGMGQNAGRKSKWLRVPGRGPASAVSLASPKVLALAFELVKYISQSFICNHHQYTIAISTYIYFLSNFRAPKSEPSLDTVSSIYTYNSVV